MKMIKVVILGVIMAVLVTLLLGVLLSPRQPEASLPLEPAQKTSAALNLGFTYLQVNPQMSTYYNLGLALGALVTEVIPGSSSI